MGKCQSCREGRCKQKYENRHMCDDPKNCTCTCQESAGETFWKSFGSIAMGTAAFVGGVALTVSTGGLGAIGIAAAVGGGALTGVGATAVIKPVTKQIEGERMTGGDYVKDLVISGTIGAVTGPIGLGGAGATSSIASKVGTEGIKQGAVKLGCRSATGAVSGAASGIIQEVGNIISDDTKITDFSFTNVLKSTALGAATGGASHCTGNVVKHVDQGVMRSFTKVATDTASTVAIDATCQAIADGSVDMKKLALNAGARAATSAGYEAVTNATYKYHGGKEALRDKLGDKEILDNADSTDREAIEKAKEYLKKLPSEKIEEELIKATKASGVKKKIENLEAKRTENKDKKSGQQIKNQQRLLQKTEFQPEKMGDQNIHALDGEHIGQIAADLPGDSNNNGRGTRRVVFDIKAAKGGEVKYKIAGITNNHKYDEVPNYGEASKPELKKVQPFLLPKEEEEDDE